MNVALGTDAVHIMRDDVNATVCGLPCPDYVQGVERYLALANPRRCSFCAIGLDTNEAGA